MKRPIIMCVALGALACGESRPADESPPAPVDSAAAAVVDTSVADSVMARDTARQLPEQ